MIAAAKGHEKTVKKLMRLGASLMHSSSMKLPSGTQLSKQTSSSDANQTIPVRINRRSS
jgi:hypothetical protein